MVPPVSRFHAFAAAVAFFVGGYSSIFASALDLEIADCSGVAHIPTGSMTEDVNVFLCDATSFKCEEMTTVKIDGPYEFRVTSDSENVKFTNVRFEISGGAKFFFSLAVEEIMGTATFTGIAGMESDGGVFNVGNGSSATFSVPMTFESNSIAAEYSGGALYVDGKVNFEYDAVFTGNQALTDGNGLAGYGAGMCVASGGEVTFESLSTFTENEAESGGYGGAIANFGDIIFKRTSRFESNTAKAEGGKTGGDGGAIYTGLNSTTVFERRAVMRFNVGASGGALYNLGTTILESAGYIRGNDALGISRAIGGHMYTNGSVSIAGDVNFRDGFARGDGGAVYIDNGGSLTTDGAVAYINNFAFGNCPNLYARGQDPVCQA